MTLIKEIVTCIIFLCTTTSVKAQSGANTASKDSLFNIIQKMDSVFFNAFNACDTSKTKTLFTKDLEFYHDAGGLTNYDQNLNSIRYRCNNKAKVRRELVKESLEVYPIANYGAIQIGLHKFYYTEAGKSEQLDGTFRFVHIWVHTNNEWKISRVISYDH